MPTLSGGGGGGEGDIRHFNHSRRLPLLSAPLIGCNFLKTVVSAWTFS